jgi:hypothetical protein
MEDTQSKEYKTSQKFSHRKYLKELDEVDKELLRLKLEKASITYIEMAEAVGLTTRQICKRTLNPTFQKTLAEYQKRAIDIIVEAKERAARKLIKLIDSENDTVASKVCIALLAAELPAQRVKHEGEVGIGGIQITIVKTGQEVPLGIYRESIQKN